MLATVVLIEVKKGCEEKFEAVTRYNHENARKESGNIRFDFLKANTCDDEKQVYYLYEVYADEAAAAAHKETEHYKRWRDEVADYMFAPRQGTGTTPLAFD